jgi:hypothetical protein
MRGKCNFRKTDIKKAIEAIAKATGAPVQRIEIDRDGKIIIITGKPGDASGNRNEWDTLLDDQH